MSCAFCELEFNLGSFEGLYFLLIAYELWLFITPSCWQVMGQLPFPLSYIIPWSQRKEVMRRYAGIDAAEVRPFRLTCSIASKRETGNNSFVP